MIVLYKTSQDMTFGLGRKVYTAPIYVRVDFPEWKSDHVVPRGEYYAIVDGKKLHLDFFTGKLDFDTIKQIEDGLVPNVTIPAFTQDVNIVDAVEERIRQFALIKIDMQFAEDNTDNFGINSSLLVEEII